MLLNTFPFSSRTIKYSLSEIYFLSASSSLFIFNSLFNPLVFTFGKKPPQVQKLLFYLSNIQAPL
ncbi:MAG: hypothetical protein C0169_03880 [Thermodesulfobacterium geofontis]|uniref:Uncharacterized protein n=1 Tax=Thermodesulfobacterium geofontis TaxID=1295609 RepID=A0A2N7QEU4_9BACT|nr:MAG: hypothetical protein C0169_03880 [Thermodesulfobacterium geofontis]